MELLGRAAPGVELRAEQAVESACHLADAAGPGVWSTGAAEDVLDAIDTLAEALGSAGEDVAQALAAVAAATTTARRHLGLTPAAGDEAAIPGTVPGTRSPRRMKRRGLGPGFQGIR
ncbi:hypothetical protein [Streptomyces goshikiensis]|uniref:hypothetical protein n=1 Tax=Streptomyces goshikiensis TaxID=1942 RepID=UPI00379EA900